MERAAVVCDGDEIRGSHILFDEAVDAIPAVPDAEGGGDEQERVRIIAALAACAGNQTYAARKLGISRTTLQNKLVLHRIPRPRKPVKR